MLAAFPESVVALVTSAQNGDASGNRLVSRVRNIRSEMNIKPEIGLRCWWVRRMIGCGRCSLPVLTS